MKAPHRHFHQTTGGKLQIAFALTGLILIAEIAGTYFSHSLALFSDAGHVFTDLIAIGMAWFAAQRATKPPDARNTFGYQRTGILAAFTSALMLIAIVGWIGYEAFARLRHPQPVTPAIMVAAAAVGIAVNLYIAFGLTDRRDPTIKTTLNLRAVILHALGDVGASAGVIVGAIVILWTGWSYADPLISVGIAVLIAVNAGGLWRQTTEILMAATPKGLDVEVIVAGMIKEGNVKDVHDVHIWSLSEDTRMLSAHVQVTNEQQLQRCDALIQQLRDWLKTKYSIAHVTLQVELTDCPDNDIYCKLACDEDHADEHPSHPFHGVHA